MCEKYSGWTNHSTWCVNLHLTNEQGSYNYWRGAAVEAKRHAEEEPHEVWTPEQRARFDLADRMRDELEEAASDAFADATGEPPDLLWVDLLTSALGDTNWNEVAAAFLEDYED